MLGREAKLCRVGQGLTRGLGDGKLFLKLAGAAGVARRDALENLREIDFIFRGKGCCCSGVLQDLIDIAQAVKIAKAQQLPAELHCRQPRRGRAAEFFVHRAGNFEYRGIFVIFALKTNPLQGVGNVVDTWFIGSQTRIGLFETPISSTEIDTANTDAGHKQATSTI